MSFEKSGLDNDEPDEPRAAAPPQAPVETDAGIERKRNYFIRHWRGELSLPKSYWINGILALIVSSIFVGVFTVATESLQNSHGVTILVAIAALVVPLVALQIWQSVGIWRSSNRHEGRGGSAIWAGLAKLAIILGVIRFCFEFSSSIVPLISEHFQIALGDVKFGESHFKLLRDGRELEFSGGINIGVADKLFEALDAAPGVKVLRLSSHGGRILEADRMADEIRKRKLVTYVSTTCESACTHLFFAGRERWISDQGKLGFHRPSSGISGDPVPHDVSQERQFLASMNLPQSFIAKVLSTPSSSMWYPTHAELRAANAITGIADRTQFAASGSFIANTTLISEALLKIPIYVSLKRYEPETYEKIVQQLTDGYKRGGTEEEIASGARTIIGPILRRSLPYASEDIVLASADILIAYSEGLKTIDPESCVALFDGSKGARMKADLVSHFPAVTAKELTLNNQIIESKSKGAASLPTEKEIDPYLTQVFTKLASRPELKISLLDSTAVSPPEYKAYCEAAAAFFSEVRRLPNRDAAALLRYLFSQA